MLLSHGHTSNHTEIDMGLTQEEIKIIRKALQIVRMAHMVVEVDDGKDDRVTKLDALLKRFREAEEAQG